VSELLQRAVQILEVLRTSDQPLSIRQVADRAELAKSTVQRLLRDLTLTDLVGQDPATQRYHLGPRTLALGVAYQRRLDVRQVALPHMTRLRDETGETIGLSVGYGDEVLHIEQVASQSQLRAMFDIGRPLPLWSGAPSRLLLAERDDAEVQRILTTHRDADVSPVAPPSVEHMYADVLATREANYALAVGETLPGVSTLSVPVRDASGTLVAVLSVTCPSTRLTENDADLLLPRLRQTAQHVSRELGWVQSRPPEGRALTP
jgi:DNA-binding IclR family transcriptional regulator